MHLSSALAFLFLPCIAISINVAPKTDFGEASPVINPGIVKSIIEKNLEPTVSPGVVKAVLEVNVGGLDSKSRSQSKADDKKKTKNQILICTVDGKCKLHELVADDSSEEDEKNTLKPIIVTDFNVDPSKDKQDRKGDKKDGKDIPDIPVYVGYKGLVQNDGIASHSGHNHQFDRLPVYYGFKLSPSFHQTYPPPGSIVYEEDTHYPPTTGSYPRYPHQHGVSYLYSSDEHGFPGYTYGNSFSGHSGARTPTPYGKYYPTSKPNYQGITSLHRRAGGGDWSSTPGVYWSIPKPRQVPQQGSSGWVGSNSPGWAKPTTPGIVSSNRPAVYWPPEKPNENYPTPGIVYVHDKMDFDRVPLNGRGDIPSVPINPGKGEVTVDGKLGEPLDKEES